MQNKMIIVHGYIRHEIDQRIRQLIGEYYCEEIYLEGGYEITVAMNIIHPPRYLEGLYTCLLLNDYVDSSSEYLTASPQECFEKVQNKKIAIKDLPGGPELLTDYPNEEKAFCLVATILGYDYEGNHRYEAS